MGLNNQIIFDYYKNRLIFKKGNKTKNFYFKNFKRNDLFKEEIKLFIKSVKNKKKIDCDIKESYKLLNDFKLLI